MKSDGNRSRLRRTALFRFPVVTPYKGAKSKSGSTFSPRITRMTCATCRIKTSSLLMAPSSRKQPRHLHNGGVENVEKELRDNADGEHEQCDRNYQPLLVRPELGKSDTGFDERAAEERLHRTHEDNGSEEETENRHSGERSGHGEGTFEDKKFADKSVQSGQSER